MEAISAFFTDPLRLTLGAAAVVVLLGIFVFGRKGKTEPAEELSSEEIVEHLIHNDDENVIVKESSPRDDDDNHHNVVKENARRSAQHNTQENGSGDSQSEDMFVVLHVVAPEGMAFTGNAISYAVDECHLVYGDFKIFHYPHPENESLSLFSVANMLKPGFFEASKMADLTTTGVSFFMRIPVMKDQHQAVFTTMLATAQAMSRHLGGSLLDDKREPLTQSRVEELKKQIDQFENKLATTNKVPS
jgi:cell division protein ZipA